MLHMKRNSPMNDRRLFLEHSLLTALTAAVESGRPDVAEHLLCAMECLCGDVVEGSTLEVAYRVICGNSFKA